MLRYFYGLVVFFFLLMPQFCYAQSVTLSAIEKNPHSQSWQIKLNAPASIQVHAFLLKHPDRWVVDITQVQQFNNQVTPAALTSTPIMRIRSAYSNNQLRIVFDLRKKMAANSLQVAVLPPLAKFSHPGAGIAEQARSKDVIVVIDPGHGGKDPGATGIKNIHEKTIVLSIARKLQNLINQQPGFKAVLTRNNDYYLTLRQRLAIARKNHADMFIAIHADAYPDPLAHGVSVFALSQRGATSEAARWLAARENQSELMGGVELNDKGNVLKSVLINLSQTATIQASLLIGGNLLDNMHDIATLHHPGVEQAAFVVLKSPDIPSLLIETGFLSNSHEEVKLSSATYQNSLAHAMMLGIKEYFLQRPPPNTWLAMHARQVYYSCNECVHANKYSYSG
ncbi:MAG: N-acetylmuramoyl-L-alanine amidase [Proteobacteria bacterium]|nr:N-acetylmuramoyl-L-alanine amidase [Pseudomonadota bacterium]